MTVSCLAPARNLWRLQGIVATSAPPRGLGPPGPHMEPDSLWSNREAAEGRCPAAPAPRVARPGPLPRPQPDDASAVGDQATALVGLRDHHAPYLRVLHGVGGRRAGGPQPCLGWALRAPFSAPGWGHPR
jgi:hypothetical protein